VSPDRRPATILHHDQCSHQDRDSMVAGTLTLVEGTTSSQAIVGGTGACRSASATFPVSTCSSCSLRHRPNPPVSSGSGSSVCNARQRRKWPCITSASRVLHLAVFRGLLSRDGNSWLSQTWRFDVTGSSGKGRADAPICPSTDTTSEGAGHSGKDRRGAVPPRRSDRLRPGNGVPAAI
jgi:hypothetical protein